ncbi:hypothetical protein M1563_02130 [Patescibacteria group bacterium]|nr:hypothetical protein [Patescibacteria group bacterium]MCL5410089.1 hypothetical protein [Patescibacteria group bacterium]
MSELSQRSKEQNLSSPDIAGLLRKSQIVPSDIEEAWNKVVSQGLKMTRTNLPNRVGVHDDGEIVVNLKSNATVADGLHELVHLQQFIQAKLDGVPTSFLVQELPVVNRALIEIQAIDAELDYLKRLPDFYSDGLSYRLALAHRGVWENQLKLLGFQVPETILNPLSPDVGRDLPKISE